MKVSKLIKVLEKCDKNMEVYLQDSVPKKEDGVMVYSINQLDSVYEVKVKEEGSDEWTIARVELCPKES